VLFIMRSDILWVTLKVMTSHYCHVCFGLVGSYIMVTFKVFFMEFSLPSHGYTLQLFMTK
jgi:hypothetical protein